MKTNRRLEENELLFLTINIIKCMSSLIITIINYPRKCEKTKKVGIEKMKGLPY